MSTAVMSTAHRVTVTYTPGTNYTPAMCNLTCACSWNWRFRFNLLHNFAKLSAVNAAAVHSGFVRPIDEIENHFIEAQREIDAARRNSSLARNYA